MAEECLPTRQPETTVLSISHPTEEMVTGEIALLYSKILNVIIHRKDSLYSSLMVTVLKADLLLLSNAVINLLKTEEVLVVDGQCSHKAVLRAPVSHHAAMVVAVVVSQDLQVEVAEDHLVDHQAADHAAAEEEDFNFL